MALDIHNPPPTINYLQLPQGFGEPPVVVHYYGSIPAVGDILFQPLDGPDNSYYQVVQIVRGTKPNALGMYENVVVCRGYSKSAVGTPYFGI